MSEKVTWNTKRTGEQRRPVVFVSSSVYDKEDMLRQIFSLLVTNRYEPWMSYKGSLAADSYRSAFGNCLHAVEDADLFIGIISPWYGSGVDKSDPKSLSITHQEMCKALQLKKPRILLVDSRVVTVKRFLDSLGFKGRDGRRRFCELLEREKNDPKAFLGAKDSCDIRSIDLYDEMTWGEPADPEGAPDKRIGNWVQEFRDIRDVNEFLTDQFSYLKWPISYTGSADAVEKLGRSIPEIKFLSKRGGKR